MVNIKSKERRIVMSTKEISIWKVEVFLVENLKEIPTGDGKVKIEADCSLKELFAKLEEIATIQGK